MLKGANACMCKDIQLLSQHILAHEPMNEWVTCFVVHCADTKLVIESHTITCIKARIYFDLSSFTERKKLYHRFEHKSAYG